MLHAGPAREGSMTAGQKTASDQGSRTGRGHLQSDGYSAIKEITRGRVAKQIGAIEAGPGLRGSGADITG